MASIEPNKTTKLNELKINLVDTKATFQAMQQAEIVESNQLYFIEENDDYILPIASDNALGGIKTGYPSSGKTYGVTVNSNGQAYVTVDWENTQTITGVKGGAETNYRTGDVNITKANIGLGNVENTKLSTWTGSNKITTVGTLSSGTVPWARLSGVPNGATKEGTVTSLTIKTTSPIAGGSDTATTTTGSYTIALTDAYGDTKNPYGSKTKNYVLAAPSTAAGNPSFRALVSADIPNLNASKITAGQFSNDRLANSKVTIAGNDVSLGGSLTADTLRESLGLSNAMHFIGVATVEITDNSTTDPVISGYSTKTAGDVIIDKNSSYEYVWSSAGKWERLGGDSSYKTTQTAVTAPAVETNKWVSSISQNANGVITVNYASLDTSGTWSGNAGSATKLATARTIQTNLASTSSDSFDGSANITPGVTGILPVANGGTGVSSFTANRVVMSGTSTTAALTTRAVTNNTANTAVTASTNIPTMNTLFYTLAQINNANQTHATNVYAPTTAGTANQILVSAGGTSAPTWKATGNGAAYATTTNGALTFGTLPVAQGGTGVTSIANIKAGKDGNGNTISSTYLKLSGGTMTGTIKRAGAGGNWQSGRDRALICMNSLDSYSTLASMKTDNGSWDIGAYSNQSYTDDLIFSYIKDTTYSGTNGTDAQIRFLEDSGVQANKFVVTSVSYGDKNHRPSNPDLGQLYFQFID